VHLPDAHRSRTPPCTLDAVRRQPVGSELAVTPQERRRSPRYSPWDLALESSSSPSIRAHRASWDTGIDGRSTAAQNSSWTCWPWNSHGIRSQPGPVHAGQDRTYSDRECPRASHIR
jgi:hypothetical protein